MRSLLAPFYFFIALVLASTVMGGAKTAASRNIGYVFLVKGLVHQQEADLAQSRAWLHQIPQDHSAQMGLAYGYEEQLVYEEATAWYQTAVQNRPARLPLRLIHPQNPAGYVLAAVALGQQGRDAEALWQMRQALAVDPAFGNRPFYQLYYDTAVRLDMVSEWEKEQWVRGYEQGGVVQTTFSFSEIYPMPHSAGECLNQLVGIQFVVEAVDLGPLVPVVLHWQNDQGGWQEQVVVKNLAPNGGFEWSRETAVGYPRTIYHEDNPAITHRITYQPELETHMAVLSNTATITQSSFATQLFAIEPNGFYVQGGWVNSAQGNPRLGHSRYGLGLDVSLRHLFLPQVNHTVVEGFFAELLVQPPEATTAHLTLINWNSLGGVSFDHLLFFAVSETACRP